MAHLAFPILLSENCLQRCTSPWPCHHKAGSHPDPHPPGADVPSQHQPHPQEVPDTRAGTGTAPGHPAACSPLSQGSPHCTLAVLNHVLRTSGSFAAPSPLSPCTQVPLCPLWLPQGLPLPLLTAVPPLPPGFLH